MKLKFKTKAENLEDLAQELKSAKVLPVYYFSVKKWNKESEKIISELNSKFSKQELVVRSSAKSEDTETSSMAGYFTSILNVMPEKNLKEAIKEVISSFGKDFNPEDQVLVQPMLDKVDISGVAFTRDISNNSFYYVINYDDTTGLTDTVTGGTGQNELNTLYISKTVDQKNLSGWKQDLVQSLIELEDLYNSNALDVEFGINKEGLYIFQVRPLVLTEKKQEITLEHQGAYLRQIKNKVKSLSQKHPYLAGDDSLFGVMPDWNPAEIIGVRPRPLAFSLYKEIITDRVWAESRDRYGYKNLRSFPLIISFAGMPYVDVRVSFNSFIPEDLEESLANKLVNFYLKELKNNQNNHDKVEFKIIHSCFTFSSKKNLQSLLEEGFSQREIDELLNSLRRLTNNIIENDRGLWKKDLLLLDELQKRQVNILESDLNEIEKVYWLIEDCKRYGTLPFAGLARAGFVAVQMLTSMVDEGLISKDDYNNFLNSLKTVSSSMSEDFLKLSRSEFLKVYGHLRPGTYDIMTKSYGEDPDAYFDWNSVDEGVRDKADFSLSMTKLNNLEIILKEQGIEHNVVSLFNFLKGAIEGREYAKFLFTKNISESMVLLRKLGKKFDFSRDDISYMDIGIIKNLYSSTNKFSSTINWSIGMGKKVHGKVTSNITLPPLIVTAKDVEVFELPKNEPNFITMKSVTSKLVSYEQNNELDGNILLIPSADPGFDWIFTFKIKGFITMYGGSNSHMAIRASELGIPAVIGAGELLYNKWAAAKVVVIDCPNKKVKIVQ